MTKLGNCFEAAGKWFMDLCLLDESAREWYTLVHGIAILTCPPYIRYTHAWLECEGELVLDAERKLAIPRYKYYTAGKIDAKECARYTYEEFSRKVVEHEH
jgi:hypothetical protein